MKPSIAAILTVLCLVLSACSNDQPAPQRQVRVSATKAYERYFGAAPTTDKGTCFAFVIYFPSATAPSKVIPLPFFTFDEGTLKRVAVQRLMAGMDLPAYKGEMAQPFAPTAHIVSLSEQQGVVTVDLGGGFLASGADRQGMLNALVLTLSQFQGVKGVSLLSDGKWLDFAKGVLTAPPEAVLEPAPPRLIAVTAMKDKGATAIEEIDAYFDRPVNIDSLVMTTKDGVPLPGDTFHSVFDMAAVLKPKDPAPFASGVPIRVRYKVTDKLGRHSEGDDVRPLEVKEH